MTPGLGRALDEIKRERRAKTKPLDFGTVEDPNLDAFGQQIAERLSPHFFRSITEHFAPSEDWKMSMTPDKAYTARAGIPIHAKDPNTFCLGHKVGTFYAVLFGPGDATGNESTYTLRDLVIPKRWKTNDPNGLLPRSKNGILFEVFFPLFSVRGNKVFPNLTSLSQIGVGRDNALYVVQDLGIDKVSFTDCIGREPLDYNIKYNLTTGHDIGGKRFGDPHSVARLDDLGDVMQVGGFLAITEEGPLYDRLARNLEAQTPA